MRRAVWFDLSAGEFPAAAGGVVDISEFLSVGDVVNLVLIDGADPFSRDPAEDWPENVLQGRVGFADGVGVYVYSNGGRCTAAFDENAGKIGGADLTGSRGTFFPWRSVVRASKVMDADQYEAEWEKIERDSQAFFNANGTYPESNSEFYGWRNSLSQAGYDAAYNAPVVD